MPGEISRSNKGPSSETPYVPSWMFDGGARICVCGDHEGFHNEAGRCLRAASCGCKGMAEKKV